MDYGARIQQLKFRNTDIALGFDSLDQYTLERQNFGAIVGRYIGRITGGYLKIDDNIITDAKFKTFGCGAAVATSSMATELIKGKSIDDALKLTNQAVVEALDGLPAVKIHCSVLAEQAVRSALSDYYTRQGIDPVPIVGEIKEPEE